MSCSHPVLLSASVCRGGRRPWIVPDRHLAGRRLVVAQAEGPTLTVEPDNFELISFGTCALEWTNFACETLEYCWDELVSALVVETS